MLRRLGQGSAQQLGRSQEKGRTPCHSFSSFLKSLGQAPSRELSTESAWVHVSTSLHPRQALGTGRVPGYSETGYSAMDPGQNIF